MGHYGVRVDKQCLLLCYGAGGGILIVLLLFAAFLFLGFPSALQAWILHQWNLSSSQVEIVTTVLFEWSLLSLVTVVVLSLTLFQVLNIITVPLVMQNLLLTLNPLLFTIGGILLVVALLWFPTLHRNEQHEIWTIWASCIAQVLMIVSFVGGLQHATKNRCGILLYIFSLVMTSGALIGLGVVLLQDAEPNATSLQEWICKADWTSSCTNCTVLMPCPGVYQKIDTAEWTICTSPVLDNCTLPHHTLFAPEFQTSLPVPCGHCPEWTTDDLRAVVSTRHQVVGVLILLLVLLLGCGIAGACILRRSLLFYQSDVV